VIPFVSVTPNVRSGAITRCLPNSVPTESPRVLRSALRI
jgi:hypothetical protein